MKTPQIDDSLFADWSRQCQRAADAEDRYMLRGVEIEALRIRNAVLESRNATLRAQLAAGEKPDSVGSWLLPFAVGMLVAATLFSVWMGWGN